MAKAIFNIGRTSFWETPGSPQATTNIPAGFPCIELNEDGTFKGEKIGDGTKTFSQLPYSQVAGAPSETRAFSPTLLFDKNFNMTVDLSVYGQDVVFALAGSGNNDEKYAKIIMIPGGGHDVTFPGSWINGGSRDFNPNFTNYVRLEHDKGVITYTIVYGDPQDTFAPVFTSMTLSGDNAVATIQFDEGTYINANGTGGLDPSCFSPNLNIGDGNGATDVTITDVVKSDNNPTSGGENVVKLQLSWEGTPNGTESILFNPHADKIHDQFGNAMGVAAETDEITLNNQSTSFVLDLDASDLNGNNVSDNPANGSDATPWVDKSGNLRNFSFLVSSPTIVDNEIVFVDYSEHLNNGGFDPSAGNGGVQATFAIRAAINDTDMAGHEGYLLAQWNPGESLRSWRFFYYNGKIRFSVSSNGGGGSAATMWESTNTYNDGTKRNYFVTFNAGVAKLYVDGVEQTFNIISGVQQSNFYVNTAIPVMIGGETGSGSTKGIIADIQRERIYASALDQTAISALHSAWAA